MKEAALGRESEGPVSGPVFGELLLSPAASPGQGGARSEVSAVHPDIPSDSHFVGFPFSFLYVYLRFTWLSPCDAPATVLSIFFNPHNPMSILTPILQMRNRSSETLRDLPEES